MSHMNRVAHALRSPALAAPISVAVLALLASGASLVNGFVYDDLPMVARSSRVHTLARWWEVFGSAYWPPAWGNMHYRPVTVLSFAVQWALGNGSTIVFHSLNIALYLATCLAVLRLAQLVLPATAAWTVAALFAVHPVHVEAVANVVGQSELLVALCSALAVGSYVRRRITSRGLTPGSTAAIGGLYAIACFSKEPGFLLAGLLVAAELTVVGARLEPGRRALRVRARELWAIYGVCVAIAIGYLFARRAVLGRFGDEANVLVWRLSQKELLLTMLGVVPEWARLLLWPAHLAADYSPPRIPLLAAPTPAVLSGVVILAGAVAIAVAGWRLRTRVATFGLLWFAITIFPVSNVFVLAGVLLSERSLFLPSIGVMLALGPIWAWTAARISTLRRPSSIVVAASAGVALAVVLMLGAVKSASRSRVWRSTDTFYSQIVEDSPLSYRAQQAYGTWLFMKGRRAEGEKHLRIAIAMFPYDAGPHVDLADSYRFAGLCAPARDLYQRVLGLGMLVDRARLGLILCLLQDGQYGEAAAQARIGASENGSQVAAFRRLLAAADSGTAASPIRQTGAPRPGRQGGNAP
jgi:protein O-mannosyl-transferase